MPFCLWVTVKTYDLMLQNLMSYKVKDYKMMLILQTTILFLFSDSRILLQLAAIPSNSIESLELQWHNILVMLSKWAMLPSEMCYNVEVLCALFSNK